MVRFFVEMRRVFWYNTCKFGIFREPPVENRRALCYNNVLHQSESKIGGICFGTSNHCDLPGGAEPAVGNLPRNRKLLECAGAHAPCLCRYLRLPAERGGFRAHPRHAARVRLPHVRHRGGARTVSSSTPAPSASTPRRASTATSARWSIRKTAIRRRKSFSAAA